MYATNSVIIKGHNDEIDSSSIRKRKTLIKKKILYGNKNHCF